MVFYVILVIRMEPVASPLLPLVFTIDGIDIVAMGECYLVNDGQRVEIVDDEQSSTSYDESSSEDDEDIEINTCANGV